MSRPLTQAARLALATALVAVLTVGLVTLLVRATGEPEPAAPAAASADDAVDQVVAISVDGLNPDALRVLGRSGAPGFHRLVDHGASTLDARTEYERTITLPNHTGMLTGRWITRAGGHRVTFNEDTGGTLAATAGSYVPGIFDVVHDRGGSTAFYSSKDKLDYLDRSWNRTHGARDRVGADDGRDKLDRYLLGTESANVTALLARLRSAPDDLSFVHLAHPDRAGHAHGFMSQRYLQAVREADTQLGRILDAVRASPSLRAHTTVVLTADHGGRTRRHDDRTKAYNYTIPFMAWGVGVARGADLYALNPRIRRAPGAGRPTYDVRQPVRNGEVANLVADLLDLPPVPGSTFDAKQRLRVG
jgi:hypothetical protein